MGGSGGDSDARPGPRRRLRCPVRAAHRAAGARGPGVQRDRPAHDAGGRAAREEPGRDRPLGRPSSVYAQGAPAVDPAMFTAGVPAFGICYGFQAMALALGGTVARTGSAEFGRTSLEVVGGDPTLFHGLPREQSVWMSHNDAVSVAPEGFDVVARTGDTPVAAFEDTDRGLAGVQFHPEVLHTEHGQAVLEHFLYEIAGIEPTWTTSNVIDEQVAAVRAQVGDRRVLCALSGGVDSAV